MVETARVNPWRLVGWGVAAAGLAAPAVAMRLTDEIVWGPPDFAVAALLIGGTGLGLELAVRRSGDWAYRAAAAIALAVGLILARADLAVGIIGDEAESINLLFLAIPAGGLAGAMLVRFRAAAMAVILAACACTLAAGAILAFSRDPGPCGPICALLASLWLVASALFNQAARRPA